MSDTTSLSFAIYLRGTPQQVRAVLTDPALVPRWLAGAQFHPDSEEDPRRLSCEWLQTDHLDANGGYASVVRFELVAMGEVTRLAVAHRDLAADGSYLKVVAAGWPMILSSLKTLIETGKPLEFRHSGEACAYNNREGDSCTRSDCPCRPESPRPWPRRR